MKWAQLSTVTYRLGPGRDRGEHFQISRFKILEITYLYYTLKLNFLKIFSETDLFVDIVARSAIR